MILLNLREEPWFVFSWKKMHLSTASMTNLKDSFRDTAASLITLSISKKSLWPSKKLKKPKLKYRPRSRKSERNGLLKEKSSMKIKSRTKLIEQLLETLRLSNSKESTRINHFGFVTSKKSKRKSTNNSTKMFSRIQVILWPGPTSPLRDKLTSLDSSSFLSVLLMISSKSFMKRNLRSSFTLEEFWWTTNSRNFYPNILISLRLLWTLITYLWTLPEKVFIMTKL